MRLLFASDEEHRLYIDATAKAIRMFRPNVEVALTDLGELEAAVDHFHPQLVICSAPIPPNPVDPKLIASIVLSPEPNRTSTFRIKEQQWESTNPSLGELLSVVDETNSLYKRSREEEPTDTKESGGLGETNPLPPGS